MSSSTPRLKLGPLADDKPVKVTVELPAALHRNLVAYAEILGRDTGKPAPDPVRLIVPMLERFIATDKAFIKARRVSPARDKEPTRNPPAAGDGMAPPTGSPTA